MKCLARICSGGVQPQMDKSSKHDDAVAPTAKSSKHDDGVASTACASDLDALETAETASATPSWTDQELQAATEEITVKVKSMLPETQDAEQQETENSGMKLMLDSVMFNKDVIENARHVQAEIEAALGALHLDPKEKDPRLAKCKEISTKLMELSREVMRTTNKTKGVVRANRDALADMRDLREEHKAQSSLDKSEITDELKDKLVVLKNKALQSLRDAQELSSSVDFGTITKLADELIKSATEEQTVLQSLADSHTARLDKEMAERGEQLMHLQELSMRMVDDQELEVGFEKAMKACSPEDRAALEKVIEDVQREIKTLKDQEESVAAKAERHERCLEYMDAMAETASQKFMAAQQSAQQFKELSSSNQKRVIGAGVAAAACTVAAGVLLAPVAAGAAVAAGGYIMTHAAAAVAGVVYVGGAVAATQAARSQFNEVASKVEAADSKLREKERTLEKLRERQREQQQQQEEHKSELAGAKSELADAKRLREKKQRHLQEVLAQHDKMVEEQEKLRKQQEEDIESMKEVKSKLCGIVQLALKYKTLAENCTEIKGQSDLLQVNCLSFFVDITEEYHSKATVKEDFIVRRIGESDLDEWEDMLNKLQEDNQNLESLARKAFKDFFGLNYKD